MVLKYLTAEDIKQLDPKGKKVLLFSGGVDSYVISKLWKPDILLYVDMNTKYSKSELANIARVNDEAEVLVLQLDLGKWEQASAFIPNRNLILLTMASEFGDTLCLGAIKDDIANDKTMEFLKASEAVLRQTHAAQTNSSERMISIEKKYKSYTKVNLLKDYKQSCGTLQELWDKTYSCYNASPCWKCKPCFRKALAFFSAGFKLPENVVASLVEYFTQPVDSGSTETIAYKVINGIYHKKREAEQIRKFLTKYTSMQKLVDRYLL